MNLFGKTADLNAGKGGKDDGNKLPPFTVWFLENQEELKEEFPELDSANLTKTAMKRYRELGAASKVRNSPSVVRHLPEIERNTLFERLHFPRVKRFSNKSS